MHSKQTINRCDIYFITTDDCISFAGYLFHIALLHLLSRERALFCAVTQPINVISTAVVNDVKYFTSAVCCQFHMMPHMRSDGKMSPSTS